MAENEENIFSVVVFGENFNSSLMTIMSVQSCLAAGTYTIYLTFPEEKNLPTANVDRNAIVFAETADLNLTLNKIFETSTGKYILFLSAGVILSSKTLSRLETFLANDEKIGAVGPLLNYCHHHNIDYTGNLQLLSANAPKNVGELEQTAEILADKKFPNRKTLVLDGACILVKREVANAVGVPDTTPENFWDADYSLRILKAGFLVYICAAAYAHCVNPYPVTGGGVNLFQNKWGFNLNYNFQVRSSLLKFLDIGRKNINVLELGCACGATLLAIRDVNPTAKIYGVEINESTAAIAKIFAEVTTANLETFDNPQWKDFFDVIIMGDIVEHLNDSKSIMAKVYNWLKQGGRAALSVPNVMHASVLAKLLLHGRFEYQNDGILDKTHLRFFTRKEILILMQNSGFDLLHLSYTKQPLNNETANFEKYLMPLLQTGDVVAEDFEAYQWQLLIEKPYQNSDADKIEYAEYIEQLAKKQSDKFVPFNAEDFQLQPNDTKVIAYYLPQFHQMEINNKFHGQGFTEWTNTSRALPLFTGHYQPHIPYDVGYYDLNNIEALQRQIYLAKRYGVYGFCFHYYWFSGEKIMEKPINLLLQHKELEMPFCVSWATENWTSIWDGGDKNVMIEQKLEDGDDEKFMADILPFFKDNRYIKIDGKPILAIYKCKTFPQDKFKIFLNSIRKIAKENGFPDIYVMLSSALGFEDDVEDWGADALVEYRAHALPFSRRYRPKGYVNPNYKGLIYDVSGKLKQKAYMNPHKSKIYYRAALTSWDNTARKSDSGGLICTGYTPQTFKTWLKDIMIESKKIHSQDKDIIFANSWNEWAEASHLEPDMYYGYAYLQALREALLETRT